MFEEDHFVCRNSAHGAVSWHGHSAQSQCQELWLHQKADCVLGFTLPLCSARSSEDTVTYKAPTRRLCKDPKLKKDLVFLIKRLCTIYRTRTESKYGCNKTCLLRGNIEGRELYFSLTVSHLKPQTF